MIKDSYTYQEISRIPKDLMTFDKDPETARVLIQKFKWIDNDTFKLVNNEGIEKKINFRNNYEELEYNVIPEFDKTPEDWKVGSYYLIKP